MHVVFSTLWILCVCLPCEDQLSEQVLSPVLLLFVLPWLQQYLQLTKSSINSGWTESNLSNENIWKALETVALEENTVSYLKHLVCTAVWGWLAADMQTLFPLTSSPCTWASCAPVSYQSCPASALMLPNSPYSLGLGAKAWLGIPLIRAGISSMSPLRGHYGLLFPCLSFPVNWAHLGRSLLPLRSQCLSNERMHFKSSKCLWVCWYWNL